MMRMLMIVVLVALFTVVYDVEAKPDSLTDYILLRHYGRRSQEDVALCFNKGKCHWKRLQCPKACPSRTPLHAGKMGCFINCLSCQATCKHKKTNCNGYGAICYDPRFVGGDGVLFYFHGKKEENFCLVSDRNLHINAHFIGTRPAGRSRDYTWVQALGIAVQSHTLTIAAKKVAIWNGEEDQLELRYDDAPLFLPAVVGSIWSSPTEEVRVERTADANSLFVVIDQMVEISLTVARITAKESRVHNYQIPQDDCFAHLDMQFQFYNLSSAVDGILGQTYQPAFKSPVKIGVPMPIMGGYDKYFSSSLESTDCKVSQFTNSLLLPSQNILPTSVVRCSSSSSQNGAILCSR